MSSEGQNGGGGWRDRVNGLRERWSVGMEGENREVEGENGQIE